MKKLIIIVSLMVGIQGMAVAGCGSLCGGFGDPIFIDPVGEDGPIPVGGDDVPHLAEILYYRGNTSSPMLLRSQVFGWDLSDCLANLYGIANDPYNSVISITKPCTPAY